MTQVGSYRFSKTAEGYTLVSKDGDVVGTFPTARDAMEKGISLTAAAYKARQRG